MTQRRRISSAVTLAASLFAAVVACSEGRSSTGSGAPTLTEDAGAGDAAAGGLDAASLDAEAPSVVGCDAGATASGCGSLTVTLQGGLSTSDCCYGCGSDTNGFSWMLEQDTVSFGVSFAPGQAPIEKTGTFPVDSIFIAQQTADGGMLEWQTPPGACTVTVAQSVCVLAQPSAEDWLSGTGHCTQPAEPLMGNTSAPVTIGDFSFRSYVLMP